MIVYYEINTLYKVNKWALIINILLFIVPWFGMLAMAPLGALQVLSAFSITTLYYNALDLKCKKLLKTYWLLVAANAAFITIVHIEAGTYLYSWISAASLFMLPGLTALYFFYTIYQIKNRFPYRN